MCISEQNAHVKKKDILAKNKNVLLFHFDLSLQASLRHAL